ncbi:cbb3-type cytochrome c oxidase subunit II [Mucilaginibacter antarcticus]|uniref:cbb3-type cytochrome c oxidase subunit II n=1 Tax=Mucilaginibacter antarcticus TaxID=1855725 RepID=UPI003637377B
MDIYNNHKRLFVLALCFFIMLTMFVAIMPAYNGQQNNAPLPSSKPLTALAAEGKGVFIAEGCTACHTQQVRNIDMDKMWECGQVSALITHVIPEQIFGEIRLI